MFITLKEGRVLIVEGPAAAIVHVGRVSIFGAEVAYSRRVVIRKGKSFPLQALEDTTLELIEGEGSTKVELAGSTIPESWASFAKEASTRRLSSIIVLGATDRGKNSFCIHLANTFLKEGGFVVLIDGDVGQGDIGPPAAISMASVTSPIFDLFTLKPESAVFIGNTTPAGVQNRILEAVSALRRVADEKRPSLTLINTDGWVLGEDAVEYKLRLVSNATPRAVVGIQLNDELEPILAVAESKGHQVIRLEPSSVARTRNRDMRRGLREQCYRKFLNNSTLRKFPFTHVRLGCTFLNSLLKDDKEIDRLIYVDTEASKRALTKGEIEDEIYLKAAQLSRKTIRFVSEDESRGLLLGLMDDLGRFLGLGVLKDIDFENCFLKVLTPYVEVPAIIRLGRIRLNEELQEVGFTQSYKP